jgi:hypothetical protein
VVVLDPARLLLPIEIGPFPAGSDLVEDLRATL